MHFFAKITKINIRTNYDKLIKCNATTPKNKKILTNLKKIQKNSKKFINKQK